jgi:hypothetical protein
MNFQAFTLSAHPDWACIQLKTPDSEARTPVHLVCVIDTSGSMGDTHKLENVKRSLHFLLDFLGPDDKISIITFSDTAKTILSQVAVTATEKDNIRTRLSIINIENSTNLSAGIVQSRETLSIDTSNTKQGILLLTDGIANLGLIRPEDIQELVRNTIDKFNGTSISSVGYGTDHNVELLQSISTIGGGSYYVVNNLEDVATVFGDILGGLVSCTSQQVRVILPAGTEVKSRYASSTTGDQLEIAIGDMPAGTEAAFLAKITNGRPICTKGFNLQTHDTFEINTVVNTTEDETLQVNGEAHFLRFEVLALLEESRALMSPYTPMAAANTQIDKITACITKITDYSRDHTHSLWDILLTELNTCKNTLQNRHLNAVNTPQIMTQRGGYLGRMRGLPAAFAAASATPGGDPADDSSPPPGALPLGRTFSNYAQRQISAQLSAVASQQPYAAVNSAGGDPGAHSSTTSPVRSPLLGGLPGSLMVGGPNVNWGIGLGAASALGVYTGFPPPPSGPLTRQVACGGSPLSRVSSAGSTD